MAEDSLSPGQSVTAGTTPETDAQPAPMTPGSGAGEPVSGSGAPAEPPKRPYPAPAEAPTQQGPEGIRFDFNDGCRVALPEAKEPWRIRLSDLDTGNILYETELKAGRVNSTKRNFIRGRIEVTAGGKPILAHDYSARDREVLIQFPVGTIGDTLGWFPYAVKFQRQHRTLIEWAGRLRSAAAGSRFRGQRWAAADRQARARHRGKLTAYRPRFLAFRAEPRHRRRARPGRTV